MNEKLDSYIEQSYRSIELSIGIDPEKWDKPTRIYAFIILSDLISFKLTEIEFKPESIENIEISKTVSDARRSSKESNKINDDAKKGKYFRQNFARIELTKTSLTTQVFWRCFIGNDYKVPVAFSLLSINNNKVIGIKASIFSLNNIHEKSYHMPITLNDKDEKMIEIILKNTKSVFKEKMKEICSNFISISTIDHFRMELKRPDNLQVDTFDSNVIIPFERLLYWQFISSISSIETLENTRMRGNSLSSGVKSRNSLICKQGQFSSISPDGSKRNMNFRNLRSGNIVLRKCD